jgi:hypothetical protein
MPPAVAELARGHNIVRPIPAAAGRRHQVLGRAQEVTLRPRRAAIDRLEHRELAVVATPLLRDKRLDT